jgi:8-oxo-dGTP diphosphatase
MDTITISRKVFAYITSGTRLLLFTHPEHLDAGIQVPAGTMNPGEAPAGAVLREAFEETGLTTLRIDRQLAAAHPYGRDEFHDRWFFHLICEGSPPETWRHGERDPSDGGSGWIPFDFFWADLATNLSPLIARHDRFIPELREILSLN